MRGFILITIVAAAYTATAVPLAEKETDSVQQRFIQFPDENGVMHEIDQEDKPDPTLLNSVTRNADNNLYLLYTRRNPTSSQTLVLNSAQSLWASFFNASLPTVFIVHGWRGSESSTINPTIRNAFLAKSDVNVIVMDWKRVAQSNYHSASAGVPEVGRGLGDFLLFLSRWTGARLEMMHLVGFCLGAHVVGNAGRQTGSRVARITGLDPAGPLWRTKAEKLQDTDALYVEAIHTDGGYTAGGLGIGTAVAQVDFFVNNGVSQPGCLLSNCNHDRAWEVYAASVSYNHLIGRKCSNTVQIAYNRCSGSELHMGNDELRKSGSGMYRVNTGRKYPF